MTRAAPLRVREARPYNRFVHQNVASSLTAALSGHGDVAAAYLFGSVARGEAGPRSDVDVGVLMAASAGETRVTLASLRGDLQEELQRAAGRPVDLVILNHAAPDLVHRVLRDGVLLVERDPQARVRFEVRARNEYFDLLPYLKRYREAAMR